jgi:ATP-dependent protease ClpP protease subunit
VKTFLIYQEIGEFGVGSSDIVNFLNENKDEDVQFRINSPGGSVHEGIAIYNLLKSHNGRVEIVIDSLCASIATIIALGGDNITMNLGSNFMIHNPWTMALGNAEEMRKTADQLDGIRDQIVSIYMSKFNGSEEELVLMLNEETWLSDVDALKYGFVNSIEQPQKMVAQVINYDLKKYFNSTPTKGKTMNEKAEELNQEVEAPEVEAQAESSAEVLAEEETTEEEQVEEKAEETTEEEAVEEEVEEEASLDSEVNAKISPEALINAKVEAGIQAEMTRREEIQNLSFPGQEDLVKDLIKEKSSISDSAVRIIENKKSLDLNAPKVEASVSEEEVKASALLKKMNSSAPSPMNESSSEGVDSMGELKKAYSASKDPKEKTLLAQKMSKLNKEQIASSN